MQIGHRSYTELVFIRAIQEASKCLDNPKTTLADIRKAKEELRKALDLFNN